MHVLLFQLYKRPDVPLYKKIRSSESGLVNVLVWLFLGSSLTSPFFSLFFNMERKYSRLTVDDT